MKAMTEVLAKDLEQRRILVSSLPDQLRWGNNNEGNYNRKEAEQKNHRIELCKCLESLARIVANSSVDESQTIYLASSSKENSHMG